jgi:hypothetical protein
MTSVILQCAVLFLATRRVVMLNVNVLSVVMLHCYSECCWVVCCYAECHFAECRYAGCHGLNKCFSLHMWKAMRMRHYIGFSCLTGSNIIILLYFYIIEIN